MEGSCDVSRYVGRPVLTVRSLVCAYGSVIVIVRVLILATRVSPLEECITTASVTVTMRKACSASARVTGQRGSSVVYRHVEDTAARSTGRPVRRNVPPERGECAGFVAVSQCEASDSARL